MKKSLLLALATWCCLIIFAQAPQGISHQAVIRDANNQLVTESPIGIKVSIIQGSIDGDVVYSETHLPTSNSNGLISFVIGQGAVVFGLFTEINWAAGPYFIETKADPAGGTNYTITGTSQMLSVPYALHAETAESISGGIKETDPTWSGNADITGNIGREGSVGIGTTSPHPSAKTEINSTMQGFLPPRMSSAQMNAISGPAQGLMVYNTSLNSVFYYNGSSWINTEDGKPCGTLTYDGMVHKTIMIGTQCWMAENLKYLPSVVGPGNGSETVPYYYVYGYDGTNVSTAKSTANYQTYGVLYNWPAALTACPPSWHLPTDAEWTALTTYVSAQAAYRCNNYASWIAKSLAATTNWNASTNTCAVGNNLSANDATGFSGLPGGNRNTDGHFFGISGYGYWWSATESSTTGSWSRLLSYSDGFLSRGGITKSFGFSVRCLRD